MLPVFKNKYSFNINNNNYKITVNTTFKKNIFSCTLKEEYKINKMDKKIEKYFYK